MATPIYQHVTVGPIPIPSEARPISAPAVYRYPRSTPPNQAAINIDITPENPLLKPYDQETVQKLILQECKGAIYEFSATSLLKTSLINPTSTSSARRTTPASPPMLGLSPEQENYIPLAAWLNTLIDDRYKKLFAFHPYNRSVAGDHKHDDIDRTAHLKFALNPDLIAAWLGGKLARKRIISWFDVDIAVEVKDVWMQCLRQALTYGRLTLGSGLRWFCPVLMVDQKKSTANIAFCTRMGVFISEKLSLRHQRDRDHLAEILCAYVELQPDKAGYDVSAKYEGEVLSFALPRADAYEWWDVDKVLFKTPSLRGTATSVYRLKPPACQAATHPRDNLPQSTDLEDVRQRFSDLQASVPSSGSPKAADDHPHPTASDPLGARLRSRDAPSRDSSPRPSSPENKRFSSSPRNPIMCIKDQELDWENATPEYLIMKDSYPLVARAKTEMEFLRAVKDQHGFSSIIWGLTVDHPLKDFLEIPGLRSCAALGGGSDAILTQEERCHRRLFSNVEGKPLTEVEDVFEIVYTCVDAFIGILNAYRLGWIHRDISIGNVLHRLNPEMRAVAEQVAELNAAASGRLPGCDFSFLQDHLRKCNCVIIDGDLAVKCTDREELMAYKSGTLSFMSERLLRAWHHDWPSLHCALDDMESVVWLLLWTLACRKQDNKTDFEKGVLEKLNSPNLEALASAKFGLMARTDDYDFAAGNDEAHDLVIRWMAVADSARVEADGVFPKPKKGALPSPAHEVDTDLLDRLTYKYFNEYLLAGVGFLRKNERYQFD
ncbi:unnamed protein product [Peniophora sp. CBMAI 1063]|nr:unnamed protein product [Peniophora sp. CBMAI 1063]